MNIIRSVVIAISVFLLEWSLLLLPQQTHAKTSETMIEVDHGVLEDAGQGVPRLEVERELVTKNGGFTKVVWSSDGTKLATYASGGSGYSDAGNLINVWSVDGQLLREITTAPGWPFSSLSPLAFVDKDRRLATSPPLGKPNLVLSVYDIASGGQAYNLSGPTAPAQGARHLKLQFSISPDQSLAAVPLGGTSPVMLYSTITWKELTALSEGPKHAFDATDLTVFSPDGKTIAWNQGSQQLVLYDLSARSIRRSIEVFRQKCCQGVGEIVFSPDSKLVAVSSPTPSQKVRSITGEITEAYVNDPIRVFRVDDGERVAVVHEPLPNTQHLSWGGIQPFVAFTIDADLLRLWDPSSPHDPGRTYRMRRTIFAVAFSPDGSRLAVANGRYITIFNLKA
jgi:WD40 repeat protein